MRVLFDQGTPDPLRAALTAHNVSTAYEKGWSSLRNGDLLNAAERGGYEVLVSTDQSLKYQQNLPARRIESLFCSPRAGRAFREQSHPWFRLLMQPSREVIQRL